MSDEIEEQQAAVAAAAQLVPDKILDNPKVQVQYVLTLKHIAYILGGLAFAAMVMVFVSYLARGEVPDTIVLLGSSVATGCISGLVGYAAGREAK